MRLRVLPVLGTMPAIMGQAAAALGKQVRHRLLQHVKNREGEARKRIEAGEEGLAAGVGVDVDDVEHLMSELWRNRCGITGERLGSALELIKWDEGREAAVDNLVLMSAKGLARWKKGGRGGLEAHVVERIEGRLEAARKLAEGLEKGGWYN
ncbi:hypothetical protein TeGR_g12157 [Tetraparma gracilis]|uniref:Uncharacterized protein n=1 Tax=Tetraparma gracilis TaxID=2962635 RepID=A0ABQ6MXF1_9STRA|nr:hypothetical protein TeGR_g12157 [Tetraparma gracilis]